MRTQTQPLLDWVRFCPHCGGSLEDPRNLVNEFSLADSSICFWWCSSCGAKGEIAEIERVTAPELVDR
ncbi:hypothetical protein [Alicyclobacillus fastidiosus]|uniref:hypothetical protein n=1 Tax=Alicyclobacillus fastidiosus TaxID=392011 RepID=UPI0034D50A6F